MAFQILITTATAICRLRVAVQAAAAVLLNQAPLLVCMAHGFTTAAATLVHGVPGTAIAAVCRFECNGEIKVIIPQPLLQAAQTMERFLFGKPIPEFFGMEIHLFYFR